MRKRIFAAVMALFAVCGIMSATVPEAMARHRGSSPFTGYIGPKPAIESGLISLPK